MERLVKPGVRENKSYDVYGWDGKLVKNFPTIQEADKYLAEVRKNPPSHMFFYKKKKYLMKPLTQEENAEILFVYLDNYSLERPTFILKDFVLDNKKGILAYDQNTAYYYFFLLVSDEFMDLYNFIVYELNAYDIITDDNSLNNYLQLKDKSIAGVESQLTKIRNALFKLSEEV